MTCDSPNLVNTRAKARRWQASEKLGLNAYSGETRQDTRLVTTSETRTKTGQTGLVPRFWNMEAPSDLKCALGKGRFEADTFDASTHGAHSGRCLENTRRTGIITGGTGGTLVHPQTLEKAYLGKGQRAYLGSPGPHYQMTGANQSTGACGNQPTGDRMLSFRHSLLPQTRR